MKSNTVIGTICWITLILHWTTDVFPNGIVPLALCMAWLIMQFFGFFKREEAVRATVQDDGLNERQREFRRKMKEGQQDDSGDLTATIMVEGENGEDASVIINENGDVTTTGDPHPDLVTAARMLQTSVIKHGSDAIAQELGKQIDKINKGNNNEK